MDFLEIRRKAKARAAAAQPRPPEPASVPTPPPDPGPAAAAPEPPPDAPAAIPAGLVALDALPAEPEPPPGVGAEELPPAVDDAPAPPARVPTWPGLSDDAFTVAALLGEDLSRLGATGVTPAGATAPAGAPPAAPQRAAQLDPLADFFFDPDEFGPLDGLAVSASAAAPEAQPVREFLTFSLGAEVYGVEIERVREVLKAPAVTEVPRAPAHVLGVIMVRGDVIAVLDPRLRLGLPPAAETAGTKAPRVLVCDAGEGTIGLLVDAVSGVVRLRAAEVEPRPQGIGGVSAEYISGLGRDRGRLVILLDLAAVLRGAPAREARA